MSVRTVGIGTLFLAGIAFGSLSLAIARREPAFSFAGELPTRAAAELIAGWSLLAVGLVAWMRRRGSGFGALLVAASFGWFLLEWNNPGIDSALGFALGLTLYAVAPPLVAHAALVYPASATLAARATRARGRVRRGNPRARARAGARVRPCERSLSRCPSNLLLIEGSHSLYDALNRIGVYAGLAWSLALAVLLVVRVARSSPGAPPAALAGASSRRGLPRARRLDLRGQPRPRRARKRSRSRATSGSPRRRRSSRWRQGSCGAGLRARHRRDRSRAPRRRGGRFAGPRRPS